MDGQAGSPAATLTIARAEARAIGVTRLADVTRLDIIGIPVWQAVRPWGRSLSLHQGKGLDPETARIAACMEAIECARAEIWDSAERLTAAWDELPPEERAPAADDFATLRGGPDHNAVDWAEAERLGAGGRLWAPVDAVSLDFTRPGASGIERSSNGQGAGLDIESATLKALCEVIERDAYAAFAQLPLLARMRVAIDTASISFDWFREIDARLGALGLFLGLWRLPAAIDLPAYGAEIFDLREQSSARAAAAGTAAHPDPEAALRAAVVEAAQSRLTQISGVRDDIDARRPSRAIGHIGLGLPLPAASALDFDATPTEEWPNRTQESVAALTEALARAGYDRTARIVLSPPGAPVTVVKAFCPGLGAFGRRRRDPIR